MRKEWTPKNAYRVTVDRVMSEDVFVGDVKGLQGIVKPPDCLFKLSVFGISAF